MKRSTRACLVLGAAAALAAMISALGCDSGVKKATDPGCAASGASCAVSRCCANPSEACLPQGADYQCLISEPPPTDGTACNGAASSTLDGVSLVFPDARCAFTQAEAAAGISIAYQVVVAHDVAGVHPVPGDAGRCEQPDPATGLIVTPDITGGGQRYCLCDTGLCPSTTFTSTLVAGTYAGAVAWDGRNWTGPSDTGNPKGAPFPPGTYNLGLHASATTDGTGDVLFDVQAIRHITITP